MFNKLGGFKCKVPLRNNGRLLYFITKYWFNSFMIILISWELKTKYVSDKFICGTPGIEISFLKDLDFS